MRLSAPLFELPGFLICFLLCAACSENAPETTVQAPAIVPWFTDITRQSGLDFQHQAVPTDRLHMPAIMGGGAAFFDFDNDGDLDIYLSNAGQFPPESTEPGRGLNRLYRREADGRYTDVTAGSGLGDSGYGMGIAIGDIDNDGRVDVYVSNYGPDRLYRNLGDGSFTDITEQAGAGVEGWSASAAFCDFDRDGFLDIYVTRYVNYLPAKACSGKSGGRDFCGPKSFRPVHDVLLRNRGDGTFSDISEASGISTTFASGLGLVCADFNDDGWQDVYVANDADPNQLWLNQAEVSTGAISLSDQALILGVAYNLHGQAQAGMGVVAEDLDGNGHFDLFMTHLMNEANTLYSNLGGSGGFRDVSGASRLGTSSMRFTGFGVAAFDTEFDGDLDLFIANGRVNVDQPVPGSGFPPPWNTLPEHNLFYLNDGAGRFSRLDDPVQALVGGQEISRGIASGDIDGDGDVDLLVTNLLGPARLYRNDTPHTGHWLAVRAWDPRLNRDALGARIRLVAGNRIQVRNVTTASGYLSSQSPWVHFGTGEAGQVDRIEIRWPDGLEEVFTGLAVDQAVTLQRGSGAPAGG